jgi:hypothetical protein
MKGTALAKASMENSLVRREWRLVCAAVTLFGRNLRERDSQAEKSVDIKRYSVSVLE